MSTNNIEEIASYIVSEGKGILAADESNPTCGKRFDSIGVESTENNRRDYREMLFRASGMKDNIGGVILFDETIRQNAKDGTSLLDVINSQGALPGIKVDKGLQSIGESDESLTIGLDGLDERLKEYESMGAKFTKWRAVIKIGDGMPTDECIDLNMKALADYAKLVQDNGMVPIVEPEVLMDGFGRERVCSAKWMGLPALGWVGPTVAIGISATQSVEKRSTTNFRNQHLRPGAESLRMLLYHKTLFHIEQR